MRNQRCKQLRCLAPCLLTALVTSYAAPLDEGVRDTIAATIRWQAFWEGVQSLDRTYQAGNTIEARVLRSQNRMRVFLAPIGLEVDIATGREGQVTSAGITTLSNRANSEAVASFLRTQESSWLGCIGRVQKASPSGKQMGKTLPLARPCPSEEKIIVDETVPFALPDLAPPVAIQKRTLPPDSDSLTEAVGRYLESRRPFCRNTSASIPFYSNSDPRVCIFLRSRSACPSGVATFSRSLSGEWEYGKFFADAPKEQLSGIIARIKSNTGRTVDR